MGILVVHTSCKSKREAEKIARALVAEGLAACASCWPEESFFRWKGRLCRQREYSLEAKISAGNYARVEKRILQLHSYSLPQIFAEKAARANSRYLNWVGR